jgi:hypothetical protein
MTSSIKDQGEETHHSLLLLTADRAGDGGDGDNDGDSAALP